MKILLHICCAPCAIYPLRKLRLDGHQVTGYFDNPNIHPLQEYLKRLDTLIEYAEQEGMPLIRADEYDPEAFMRAVTFREHNRCGACYHLRMSRTARTARREGFEGFTSTLFYSVYQDHDLMKDIAEGCARKEGLCLACHDFREGWREGVSLSRKMGMYRQRYCGCLYSEKERYLQERARRRESKAKTGP
ncbi:MAG: epoxyqueuosine reductase QueH [Syntrophales bacterium]|jgi:predicted adenine nucleotide alpha hydrolase (AANH) superfamily ATPase|nr:epoxyqueuosine reductase QueH [Syntrophales bacterium]MCK9527769.1 epoxyqueuosine reductase QueH [Syntrophales bacterium]MDX9921576.1 epoxyqueuosine reductase QueH [Syntrophales bacterium]